MVCGELCWIKWGVIVIFFIISCSNSKYETKTGTNDQNIQHNFPLNCSPLNFEHSVTRKFQNTPVVTLSSI